MKIICKLLYAFAILCLATSLLVAHADQTIANGQLAIDRAGFHTRLIAQIRTPSTIIQPTSSNIHLVSYHTAEGDFPAYLCVPDTDAKRFPAIIWITGGFDNSIDDTVWKPQPASNDQSASAFWKNGIVTFYPSLRGGNSNPGYVENCYGEVDDILAAYKYVRNLSYVDPSRIYLGGHSTGGTLALLVAESTDRFRAVFSFGPVSRITDYGRSELYFDYSQPEECRLRSPILYLDAIKKPTIVIEGSESPNYRCLKEMSDVNSNPNVHFRVVNGYDHFSELALTTPRIAKWILNDNGAKFVLPGSK